MPVARHKARAPDMLRPAVEVRLRYPGPDMRGNVPGIGPTGNANRGNCGQGGAATLRRVYAPAGACARGRCSTRRPAWPPGRPGREGGPPGAAWRRTQRFDIFEKTLRMRAADRHGSSARVGRLQPMAAGSAACPGNRFLAARSCSATRAHATLQPSAARAAVGCAHPIFERHWLPQPLETLDGPCKFGHCDVTT